ncbi:MAG TPA: hypothetical protein VML75_12965 [Kofleriaceae bacterium]|nr:hypothetical protein [Kofleriaceae bacterium]
MKRFATRAGLAAALLLALVSLKPALAVVTSTWVVDSYSDWDAGDAENAIITSLGEIKPGWATDRTELEVDGVWTAVYTRDGSVLLGTDDEGAIYKVNGGKVSKLATIPDVIAVVSLAVGPDDTVYAGTMPEGQVWKVDGKSGKATKLAALKDVETVWSLAVDASGSALYAGTGPDGKLFRIEAKSGSAKLAFDTGDKRVLSLATGTDGAIWLGTSDKALVFRYDPKSRTARAMGDFSGNEITALAPFSGGVVVAANDFEEPSTSGMKTKAAIDTAEKKTDPGQAPKTPKTGTKPGADGATSSSAEVARKGERKGKGALYRVYGDSRLEQLHALTQSHYTSLAVTEDGRIYAGAGDKGRIYLIDSDDSVSTAFDVVERMVAALLYDKKHGISFATTDAAAFYRSTGLAKQSSYTSKVWDAKAPAQFGKLAWRSAGKLKVETRSGNTAKPGVGWSKWAAPRAAGSAGASGSSGKVGSPSGRYFQFRVSFSGDPDAVLRNATLYYLPQNQPTQIEEVTIGASDKDGLVTTKAGTTKPRSPVLKVKWKVSNPDDDATEYVLSVRREGEVLWRAINTGKSPLTATNYDWNTETFPDGWYRLRIAASDRPANSADRSLETYKTSPLFLVDNERPTLDGINVTYPNASARAVDALSTIAEMAFSVNDGPWMVGATRDGLFDDVAEMLRIELPKDLPAGVHTLAIRVADEAGNIGSETVTFRVK